MILAEMKKNALEAIKISSENYMGNEIIDIRVSNINTKHITRKGLTMSTKKFSEFCEVINAAHNKFNNAKK